MTRNKIGIAAAAIGAAAALGFGGAALASASADSTPTPSSSAPAGGQGRQGMAQHQHTQVAGDELAKVTAAVTAKAPTVTVTAVQKDPDGSYDVDGTMSGSPVRFEVSADLKTITEGRGGPGGMGRGGSQDTPVTGAEATKAGAAVTAKDPAVTVTSVRKDPDGSYDVLGTRNGSPVFFDVSKDLATVTENSGGPGGRMGHGGRGMHDRPGQNVPNETAPTASADA